MVLGLGSICICLSILAVKMKKMDAAVLFILSFLASMGMGQLDGAGHHCVGQGLLMWSVLILLKAKLNESKL
ncbi:MAG: hypothetical protein J6A88_01820 [Oscillospiraceae bacterium]|nr:hypothetical protein [Oscillospiraceae bacterium]